VGDVDDLDVAGELRQELADVAGYGALALLTDRWTWRTWAAVVLAGMAWRVLGREQVTRYTTAFLQKVLTPRWPCYILPKLT